MVKDAEIFQKWLRRSKLLEGLEQKIVAQLQSQLTGLVVLLVVDQDVEEVIVTQDRL
jgi:hypothetical protein